MGERQTAARTGQRAALVAVVAAATVLVAGAVIMILGAVSASDANAARDQAREERIEGEAALAVAEDDYTEAIAEIDRAIDEVLPDISSARDLVPFVEELRDHYQQIVDSLPPMRSAAAAGDPDAYNAAADQANAAAEASNDVLDRLADATELLVE